MRASEAQKAIATGDYTPESADWGSEPPAQLSRSSQIDPNDVQIDPSDIEIDSRIDPNDVEIDSDSGVSGQIDVPGGMGTKKTAKVPTWGQTVTSAGYRTVPAILGGIGGGLVGNIPGAMGGGAAGALAGEIMGERYEVGQGLREDYNPWQLGTQTALGAVPIPGVGKIPGAGATAKQLFNYAKVAPVAGAVKGGLLGAASTVPTEWAETGELPSLGQVAKGGLYGAGFGALTSGAFQSGPAWMRGRNLAPIETEARFAGARPVGQSATTRAQPIGPSHQLTEGPILGGRASNISPESPIEPGPTNQSGPTDLPGTRTNPDGSITVFRPTNENIPLLKARGFVASPERGPSGYTLFVPSSSGAPQYTPKPPTPTTPLNRPDVPGPIPEGHFSGMEGEDIIYPPHMELTNQAVSNLRNDGYVLVDIDAEGNRIFSKIGDEMQGPPDEDLAFDTGDDDKGNILPFVPRDKPLGGIGDVIPSEVTPIGPKSSEYQRIANEQNITMGGVRPERGVPVVHDPKFGGYQEHRRGNEIWVTHPMLGGKPQGPFASSEEAGDWIMQHQDSPEFEQYLGEYNQRRPTEGIPPEQEVTEVLPDELTQRKRSNDSASIVNVTRLEEAAQNVAKWTALEQEAQKVPGREEWVHARQMKDLATRTYRALQTHLGDQIDPNNEMPGPEDPMWTDSPNHPSNFTLAPRPPEIKQPPRFGTPSQKPFGEPEGPPADILPFRTQNQLENISNTGQLEDVDPNAAIDDEINRYLKQEDAKTPEMTDLNDVIPDDDIEFQRTDPSERVSVRPAEAATRFGTQWMTYLDGKPYEGYFTHEAAMRGAENLKRELDPNYKTP